EETFGLKIRQEKPSRSYSDAREELGQVVECGTAPRHVTSHGGKSQAQVIIRLGGHPGAKLRLCVVNLAICLFHQATEVLVEAVKAWRVFQREQAEIFQHPFSIRSGHDVSGDLRLVAGE